MHGQVGYAIVLFESLTTEHLKLSMSERDGTKMRVTNPDINVKFTWYNTKTCHEIVTRSMTLEDIICHGLQIIKNLKTTSNLEFATVQAILIREGEALDAEGSLWVPIMTLTENFKEGEFTESISYNKFCRYTTEVTD
jgi:hypothetical protein